MKHTQSRLGCTQTTCGGEVFRARIPAAMVALHPMTAEIGPLLAQLMNVTTFEEAAGATLRAILQVADQALSQSPYRNQGSLIRGLIHLRPSEGYRRLVMLEEGSDQITTALNDEALLPSTTAWRWVAEHRAAASID